MVRSKDPNIFFSPTWRPDFAGGDDDTHPDTHPTDRGPVDRRAEEAIVWFARALLIFCQLQHVQYTPRLSGSHLCFTCVQYSLLWGHSLVPIGHQCREKSVVVNPFIGSNGWAWTNRGWSSRRLDVHSLDPPAVTWSSLVPSINSLVGTPASAGTPAFLFLQRQRSAKVKYPDQFPYSLLAYGVLGFLFVCCCCL